MTLCMEEDTELQHTHISPLNIVRAAKLQAGVGPPAAAVNGSFWYGKG